MTSASPTSGFRLTHVGLRVADIDRSVAFYSGDFGMKELSRISLDTTTIAHFFAREGVLELVSPKNSQSIAKPSSYQDLQFVKLAIGVPDMAKAMEYIRRHNVKILKEAGVGQGSEVVVSFLGCDSPDKGLDKSLWEAVVTVPFVADPDGYLIEIIPY
ncbi:Glyoxalase/Bleomycin resistance protein/Dihydroxybiphenyl dioxygenase [Aspergillus filifer]